jgi:hypothetical protein
MNVANFDVDLANQLLHRNVADPHTMRGCSDDELKMLEQLSVNQFLPMTYKKLMSLLGHQSGGAFLRDWNYEFSAVKRMQQSARRSSALNQIALPATAYIFMNMVGTNYYYFLTEDRDDNPSVYVYTEGEEPQQATTNFTDFVDLLIAYSVGDDEDDSPE